jgi:hypothetical protein
MKETNREKIDSSGLLVLLDVLLFVFPPAAIAYILRSTRIPSGKKVMMVALGSANTIIYTAAIFYYFL